VLVLSGIAKIFSVKRSSLQEIKDFSKAWFFFLQFMQNGAMSTNEEVSLAALKSFQEALMPSQDSDCSGMCLIFPHFIFEHFL